MQYVCYDPGIVLQLSSTLGKVLGFDYKTVFSGTKQIVTDRAPHTLKDRLKDDDCHGVHGYRHAEEEKSN